jgi:hypothetical protein
LQILFHKVVALPPVHYSVTVRIVQGVIASVCDGEVIAPQYTFAGWNFTAVSNFPPNSLGVVPPLQIRPATWSEV